MEYYSRGMKAKIFLLLLALLPLACAKEPAQPLPDYFEGGMANGTYPSYLILQLEQDDHRLKGRYEWSLQSSNFDFEGEFVGETTGEDVRLDLKLPPEVSSKYNFPETVTFNFKYSEVPPEVKAQMNPPGQVFFKPQERVMGLKGSATFPFRERNLTLVGWLTDVAVVGPRDSKKK